MLSEILHKNKTFNKTKTSQDNNTHTQKAKYLLCSYVYCGFEQRVVAFTSLQKRHHEH